MLAKSDLSGRAEPAVSDSLSASVSSNGTVVTMMAKGRRRNSKSYQQQRTLASSVSLSGIGVHSGLQVRLNLLPAPPNHGIRFRRVDLEGDQIIPALWYNVTRTLYCTTIANKSGASVATVEHVMAALAGLRIDNVMIEVDGPEVPIMDGSAAPFVFLIECAGSVEQDALRKGLSIRRPVIVEDEGRWAMMSPGKNMHIDIEVNFSSPIITRHAFSLTVNEYSFKRELSRARTFGFLHEVDRLRAAGLALGGSLDNAVVVADGRVLNEGGLRYNDEFARHKALDVVGDLALCGGQFLGLFTGKCVGHSLNNQLVRAVFADEQNWELVNLVQPALNQHVDADLLCASA